MTLGFELALIVLLTAFITVVVVIAPKQGDSPNNPQVALTSGDRAFSF